MYMKTLLHVCGSVLSHEEVKVQCLSPLSLSLSTDDTLIWDVVVITVPYYLCSSVRYSAGLY